MAVNEANLGPALRTFRPIWPAAVDAPNAQVGYNPLADELVVWFGRSSRAVSVPIETPGRDYVFVLVDERSEDVVGIQVDNLVADVGGRHPGWLPLARPGAVDPSDVQRLVDNVARLFARYGAGAPNEAGP